MRWKTVTARNGSKHGPKNCWSRRERLLPPMLRMQEDPNAAPVGMLFRLDEEVGVIVNRDTVGRDMAYKVYRSSEREPTPFSPGFWKNRLVEYVRVAVSNKFATGKLF